ncbi:MAG: serine/threonine protein kinase, partial [Solirubrobacteraceae bacterium]
MRADGIIESAAGTGARGFSGDGGPATLATFQLTDDEGIGGDVAAVADGGFLIADSGNNRVRRVWHDGRVTTVAGDGRALSRGDGGPPTAASLDTPQGVVAMPGGGFVVADTFGRRLRYVRPDGTIVPWAGNGMPGPLGDGAPVGDGGLAPAAFLQPWGVGLASAPDGSVVF